MDSILEIAKRAGLDDAQQFGQFVADYIDALSDWNPVKMGLTKCLANEAQTLLDFETEVKIIKDTENYDLYGVELSHYDPRPVFTVPLTIQEQRDKQVLANIAAWTSKWNIYYAVETWAEV